MNLYNFIVKKFQSLLRNLHVNWRHRIISPLLFLHRRQCCARDEGHGGGSVVAGAATGKVGHVEDAVGGEYIVAASPAQVPQGLELFRVEVDVGGVAAIAGRSYVGAGAQGRAGVTFRTRGRACPAGI